VVWWGTLLEDRQLPQYPCDWSRILDAEALLLAWLENMDDHGKVDGRAVCLTFFSHRWERPSTDVSLAHPDSVCNKKALALAQYGSRGTCPIFEPHHKFDYYFWVDYAGIHQYDPWQKVLGICKLPVFVAACTELAFFNSNTTSYEPRAWTRVERMLAYTFTVSPLFVYLDEGYPSQPMDVDAIIARDPESFQKDASGALRLVIRSPWGPTASLTHAEDIDLIQELAVLASSARPLNPMRLSASDPEIHFENTTIVLDTMHYSLDYDLEQKMGPTHTLIKLWREAVAQRDVDHIGSIGSMSSAPMSSVDTSVPYRQTSCLKAAWLSRFYRRHHKAW